MNAQLVTLLNQIASSVNPNEKVELLKKLQEVVLHRDPAALQTVFPLVLEYQRDRIVSVRVAVVDFILAVCSKQEEYIYSALESLQLMISDHSPNVQRKVVHTTLQLLPVVQRALLLTDVVQTKPKRLFSVLNQICRIACQFTLEKNESLALQSLKLIEAVIKLFSPSSSDDTSKRHSLFDGLKEGLHSISKEEVFKEAEQLLSEILKIFNHSSVDIINFQVRCAAMASLFHIMEERSAFASKIITVVHRVIQGEDSNLSNAQKVTERSSLKSLLLSAVAFTSLHQIPSVLQSLELALRNLGVNESIIADSKNRVSTPSATHMRRPPKRPYASTSSSVKNDSEQETKKLRSQKAISVAEAKSLTDSLVNTYPLSTLVEMVLKTILEVPTVLLDKEETTKEQSSVSGEATSLEDSKPAQIEDSGAVIMGATGAVSKLKRDPRLDPRLASKLARAASSTPSVVSQQNANNTSHNQSQVWKREVQSTSEVVETKKEEEEQVVPLSIGHALQKPPIVSLPNYSDEMMERFSQEACKRILFAEKQAAIGGGNALRLALLGRMLPNCKQDQSLYKEAIEFILERIETRLELAIHWLYGEAAFCVSSAVRELYQKRVFDLMKKGLKDESSPSLDELSRQTVKQLQERLQSMNVEFSKNARKSELIDLVILNTNSSVSEELDAIHGEENRLFPSNTMELVDLEKYVSERYKTLFHIFSREVSRHLTSMEDSLFAQLYVQVPILFQGAIDEVRAYIEDPSKTTAVLNALLEIITERSGRDRMRFVEVILDYSVHEDEVLRGPAIRLLSSRLYSIDSLVGTIENFAKDKLLFAIHEIMNEKESNLITLNNDTVKDTSPSHSKPATLVSDSEKSELSPGWEKLMERYCSLYVVLSSRKPRLLISLLQILEQTCNEQVIGLFKTYIPNLSRTLAEDSPELVELVGSHSPKVASFVLELLESLMDNGKKTSPEVLEAARKHFQDPYRPDCDVRYAIPFIDSFSKEELLRLLPRLVALDGSEFKHAISKTLGARLPVIQASEFLVELHLLEPKQGICSLRNVIYAIQYCFELKSIFTQDAVATCLQQLVEKSPIPILLLRTVIQSILHFPQLQKFIISVIFARLIDREVWKERKLWEGFVKACQMTIPRSVPVILRLPPQPLKDMVHHSQSIQQAIVKYGERMKESIPPWLWPFLEQESKNGD
ncbi:Symplekin [Galdieria sulphuraria]|uniref:Tight junction plaque protein Symplekin-like protein n=1 Tax=Galdieria sulphuraria TaxID=130081 RepID=M2X9H3_GALSU|nr:tight junction plaque protein Symplekin-like protein [Galdieria sulphuraria]EME26482.1 tight junction plaque protein Symplekin-like protein [Galdieria sulphuraria]GJD10010.1 Symplekin [Galdieria sulphuraria]|eukprot:XP_005703002.1 tight junction plaque protein Symplekin-like protein [Galdieria sulphuraria]